MTGLSHLTPLPRETRRAIRNTADAIRAGLMPAPASDKARLSGKLHLRFN